jgi:hypothetical protein
MKERKSTWTCRSLSTKKRFGRLVGMGRAVSLTPKSIAKCWTESLKKDDKMRKREKGCWDATFRNMHRPSRPDREVTSGAV